MTPIKEVVRKIKIAIHDEDCINYDDRDVLNVINAGYRVIRRTIAEIQPEYIISIIFKFLLPIINLVF